MTTIAAYIHPNPDPVEQTPDPEPGNYYVSVPDDSRQPRLGLLLGPFTRHAEALANVGRARIKACKCDRSPLPPPELFAPIAVARSSPKIPNVVQNYSLT